MQSFEEYRHFAEINGIDVTDIRDVAVQATDTVFDDAVEMDPWISEVDQDGMSAQGSQKLAILLHGFNPMAQHPFSQDEANAGNYKDYQRFFDALKSQLERQGYVCVVAAYDAHRSFVDAGNALARMFKGWSGRFDLSRTVIVGYSMGGLVARQMAAAGLPFARLYTTCTPHYGVMPYLLINVAGQYYFNFNRGSMSMAPHSRELTGLLAADLHLHGKYYCHGINFTDMRRFHNNDTITDCNHATMVGSRIAHRWATHIGLLTTMEELPFQPHLRGYLDKEEWGTSRWAAGEFVKQVQGV